MVSVGERNKAKGSPALERGSAPSPHPRPGVGLTHRKVSLPWHCCPGTRSCFMCREPGMSARSHGRSSCRDFTFGSWQFVGTRQEAEELQTHSAPRCWQLLPGPELVKCSFIGLLFPTGSGQEALEGQVAFPILSLTPLGALWDGGQGVRVSPPVAGAPSVLNTDYPWQRDGSKAEAAASGLIFFQDWEELPDFRAPRMLPRGRWSRACLENMKWESKEWQDGETQHLERINTSPQQELGRGKNKAGEGKPGQNKMVLVGKGIPAAQQGARNG